EIAAGERQAEENALAACGIDRMIDGVISQRRRKRGGLNSIKGVRPESAAEIDVLEVVRGGRGFPLNVRDIVAEGYAGAPEAPVQLVTREYVEPVAVLNVVQQVLGAERIIKRNQVLAGQNRSLTALIEIEPVKIDGEAGLNRMIHEIRLGESQSGIAL